MTLSSYVYDFLISGDAHQTVLDALGGNTPVGTKAHEIVWSQSKMRLRSGNLNFESDTRWAHAWMEMVITASQILEERE